MSAEPNAIPLLTDADRSAVVETLATCPFVGSAIAGGGLAVRNSARDPLAGIEDLRKLGDSGGGDLGLVLVLFATGNHAFMRGESGRLDAHAPLGFFSLEFPGSQGAHPGHSGILMGDPTTPGSGRLSVADFGRLVARAKDGLIRRSDIGGFIAENLSRDPKAKVIDANVAILIGRDLAAFGAALLPALTGKLAGDGAAAARDFAEKFTKLAGEDNLVGSAGEFGLLFALLANKPGATDVDGEPAVSVEDLESMFVRKRLPAGFENWKKTAADWTRNTIALAASAAKEFHRLGETRGAPKA
jgi:hypothetical protein